MSPSAAGPSAGRRGPAAPTFRHGAERENAMRMPDVLDKVLLAPCGMNCLVCWRHCSSKRPCSGCRSFRGAGRGLCRKCARRDCCEGRGLRWCFECNDFPCRLLHNLERTYLQRYGVSLVQNGCKAREVGVTAFMEKERCRWACSCGGIVSLHEGVCSECGRPRRADATKGVEA